MVVRISTKKTKEGSKYYFDTYYIEDGLTKRYRSKLYFTKKEAKEAELQFTKPKEKSKLRFNEIIDSYITTRRWKDSSARSSLKKIEHIREYLGELEPSEITPAKCKAFLGHLDRQMTNGKYLSNRYKNMVVMYLKSICKHADIYFNIIIKAPEMLSRYSVEKQERFILDIDTFKLFIAEVQNPDYKALYTFLMYSGCRLGEALGLHFSDISNGYVTIAKSYSQLEKKDVATKTTSSVRTLPLTHQALDIVNAQRSRYSTHIGFTDDWRLFGGKKALTSTSATRIKNQACIKAGLPHFRIHDFRHAFVSVLVRNGADISTISHYVGHSAISTTLNVYTHYFDNRLKEVINQI